MKDINETIVSPFILKISFNKYLERYDDLAHSSDTFTALKAKEILASQAKIPLLREGFTEVSTLNKYQKEIRYILQDAFSELLSNNEIKTASIPFHDIIFNSSTRFQNIINNAGNNFNLAIAAIPENDKYILACTVILKFYYGYDLNLKRPVFYTIPDAKGITRYYKILYNADFIEIIPNEKAPEITQEDVDELLDNYENIELWKSKFPENSYALNGFVISNIFDVTDDQAISNIKSSLIGGDRKIKENFIDQFQEVFQSLLNVKELRVGFSIYNKEEDSFERVYGESMESFLLHDKKTKPCASCLCGWSYKRLLIENKWVTISDITQKQKSTAGQVPHVNTLYKQKIGSVILAPVFNNKELLGVLELVSEQPKKLNSINANKLADVMPHLIAAVERSKEEEENLIEAIIQQECTSIHSSVHWKFKYEAKRFMRLQLEDNAVSFNKIEFKNVYPLYGQIDIKGSSEARNWATQQDLTLQLKAVKLVLEEAKKQDPLPIYDQYLFQVNSFLVDLKKNFKVDSEQIITRFLTHEIDKLFKHTLSINKAANAINSYYQEIDKDLLVVYKHRKAYDDTVTLVNKKMASLLDKKQIDAQNMYPHFFERFKTDGIEHSMYIGESITKENSFDPIYLQNLRLWQLQAMCEMENSFYQMQPKFPVKLDVASMVLVFNNPLTISFRMDEKKFDVDGTYNARYEVVKKRVDKAFIKGTEERITQKGKITIVYSQKQDEREYLKYIHFLQSKHYLGSAIEILELEDLQAVTGLKAIRVNILYTKKKDDKHFYSYEDLLKVINR